MLVVGAEDGDVIAALERRRLKTHVHLEFETGFVRFYLNFDYWVKQTFLFSLTKQVVSCYLDSFQLFYPVHASPVWVNFSF